MEHEKEEALTSSTVRHLKSVLDTIFLCVGILAAISLVCIMLLVLAQIVARQFNSHIPSSGDMIGFLVVWASFLGLAYTMRQQHHIRVELILSRLSKNPRRWLNIFVGVVATVMLVVFSYYVIALIYEAWEYGDKTDGEIAMPLWLMQLPMGIGCVLFCFSMMEFTWEQWHSKYEKEHYIVEED